MEFINKGLDETTLQSIPADCASEELIKAMNKQGLVQKEVQVKGKNGQTFTRKQWVKAGEDQTAQKQPKAQEETKDKKPSDSPDSSWKKPSSKKELAEMLASGMSRGDIMSKAKEAGVIWKEHDHAGINWMRCSMALTGATTRGTKSDKPVKETETKQGNSDENKKNDSPDSTKEQDKKDDSDSAKSEKAKKEMKSQLEAINQKLSNGERNCIMELQKFNSSLQEYVNSAIDESQGIYSEDAINDINKQLNQFTQSLGMNGKIEISLKKDKTMAYVNCTGITKNDSKSHKVMTFYSQDKNSGFWNSARNYEDFLKNQVKNSNLEVKSVIGSDYTQLTTEKESGTVKGEAHNMMVGKLNSEGKKQPSEKEIKTAAKELKESAIKTVIKSFNQDTIVHELAMAKQFAKLSGESIDHLTLENLYKDVVSGHGSYTQEQKCNALDKLMGKDYDATTHDDVARYANGSMANVHIRPMSKGHFEVTFEYDDGESYKETYDSVKAVKDACDRFIEKEEAESNKPKKLVNPSVSDVNKALTDKFPYDSNTKYQTIGNVDYEYPGNGENSGQMKVAVHHIGDSSKVKSYLSEIGAKNIKSEQQGKGKDAYIVLKFDFDKK